MTIAAGFLNQEGALLCADTEHQGYAMKVQDRKIVNFPIANAHLTFAYAGNGLFARSAIQKCEKKLRAKRSKDVAAEIEKILAREYRVNVLSHPDHATDINLSYRFLICTWFPHEGLALYVTDQTAMAQVQLYDCIGIGDALAHYCIRSYFFPQMRPRDLLSLAIYALASVKDYVPGCGGFSQFAYIHEDGRVTEGALLKDEHIENYVKQYDHLTRALLLNMADLELSDADFKDRLDTFNLHVISTRDEWIKDQQLRYLISTILGEEFKPTT
jgi:hypothetical protein